MLWYKLLHYWSFERVGIGSGLTLPYIIGADFIVNKKIPNSTIHKLIELNESEIDAVLSIRKCPQIGEYIIQLNEKSDLPSLTYYKRIENLYVADEFLETKKSIKELADYFDIEYMKNIRAKKFSKNNGNWEFYNEKEKKEIKNLL